MNITAFDLAQRFVGVKEVPGTKDNAMILSMLKLDGEWPEHDEVPWCSAFVNYICWLLRLPRSKSLAARSWLNVGRPISLSVAIPEFDVVILDRPGGGPTAGHVGFYAESGGGWVELLGGNQGNMVTMAPFSDTRVLGVRRLA